ncbi:MAG: UDP-N-acetylmuramoyl-L-alanine--D-glutamate ligase [Clostridiales bacterium]|nr:UDP-N-acetylmuramoyl-L-alanine--D-glutamate ligase [Clostridiales bacterium]
MFKDKKVLVVGMARSGIAAAELLINAGAIVTLNDSKNQEEIEGIEGIIDKATCDFGGKPSHLEYDIMVLSPGVPTDLSFVIEAQEKMTVLGALEVGYRLSKGVFYGITGTNGKTTTTTLTYEIFKAAGTDAYAVGNIGNPLAAVANQTTENSRLITEVSSFQLEMIDTFKAHIAAILNLAPDHLNRHKTMANYVSAKCRIAENQTEEDYLILNYDDLPTRELKIDTLKSKVVYFSKTKLEYGFYVDNGMIYANLGDPVPIMPVEDINVPGPHNIENVLAAIAISYLAGISIEDISCGVRSFKGVAHRLEYVGTYHDMICYNDSKGTNPESSIVAVKSMAVPTVLIAGGMDKGSVFDEFVQTFDSHIKHLILLGETKQLIKETAVKYGYNTITLVENMEEAVALAFELGNSSEAILLSPACASWDMYPSFEVRGEHFKSCLKTL